MRVFIGTYTDRASKGVYACELDLANGALGPVRLVAEIKNPSFLAIHPSRKFLYATNESAEFEENQGGALSAFFVAPDGALTLLNSQSSTGANPCHVSLDRAGQHALVANYGDGNVAVLPIESDGRLAAATSTIQHAGSSVNEQRQEGPHAHSINLDPQNRFALAADLGVDKVLVYRFDAKRGTLAANDPPFASLPPGSGPRHLAFHPNGEWVYVINELLSTVTLFHYDAAGGALEAVQTVSTLPEGEEIDNTTAEVQVHPSGKFLYGSNRGHDSIAMFSIDERSGRLTPLGHQPSGGKTPRNFAIDPTGAFLLAANQASDVITVHRIDPQTGRLEQTEHRAEAPTPVCLKLLPLP